MREYVTEAIVLKKEPVREFDVRLTLYTRELGKIKALVTSARKPLSKLAPHVEPLSLVMVRLAEKGGVQLTDALRIRTLQKERLPLLLLLDAMLETGERDHHLWSLVISGCGIADALSVLGFDPRFAECEQCGSAVPYAFIFREARYFCESCFPRMWPRDEYVLLRPHEKAGILG